jgi:hypothetical protein
LDETQLARLGPGDLGRDPSPRIDRDLLTVRIAATDDPDGRRVELSQERWDHILARHPELRPFRARVLEAVRTPDRTSAGRRSNECWYFLAGAGPSRWLQVVVAYEDELGRIITAFARRADP